jgi:hypothetical protein
MIRPTNTISQQHRYSQFAAFDIDVAPTTTDESAGWRGNRPFSIACAAIWMTDAQRPQVFYGAHGKSGRPAPRMNRVEVRRLVSYMSDLVARGFTLVSWSAMPLDWDILATESGEHTTCRQLALRHVDMMFHVICARGHRLSLNKAARGMGVADQVNGRNPERLWTRGHFDAVLGHLTHDVRVTLDLAHKCQDTGWVRWTSCAGRDAYLQLPEGWLNVRNARHLPLPDVSGLESPASRRALTAWMN